MSLSLRSLLKPYYKYCECGCKILIPCVNNSWKLTRYKQGHNSRGKNHPRYKGGFSIYKKKGSNNFYKYINKPYFKYSKNGGYVAEHRYIMYLYLSILYNKVTYIEGFDVHHINEDSLDNRPENLQLITRSEHKTIHGTSNQYALKDKTNVLCNLCNEKTKITPKKGNHITDREDWYSDINGYLCRSCYSMIYRLRKKFTLK